MLQNLVQALSIQQICNCTTQKCFLWGMILTAGGTWGDCVGVLKSCDRGHPMRLLQPRVTMATVSLLHSAEWFLPVDTPKTHGAEGRAERRVQKEGNLTEEASLKSAAALPVICSRYHVLLVYKLHTINGAPVWEHHFKMLVVCAHRRCEIRTMLFHKASS